MQQYCPDNKNIAVEISGDNLATCPSCGSVYVLSSIGAPTLDSPAKWPLKKYQAIYNPNNGELIISN